MMGLPFDEQNLHESRRSQGAQSALVISLRKTIAKLERNLQGAESRSSRLHKQMIKLHAQNKANERKNDALGSVLLQVRNERDILFEQLKRTRARVLLLDKQLHTGSDHPQQNLLKKNAGQVNNEIIVERDLLRQLVVEQERDIQTAANEIELLSRTLHLARDHKIKLKGTDDSTEEIGKNDSTEEIGNDGNGRSPELDNEGSSHDPRGTSMNTPDREKITAVVRFQEQGSQGLLRRLAQREKEAHHLGLALASETNKVASIQEKLNVANNNLSHEKAATEQLREELLESNNYSTTLCNQLQELESELQQLGNEKLVLTNALQESARNADAIKSKLVQQDEKMSMLVAKVKQGKAIQEDLECKLSACLEELQGLRQLNSQLTAETKLHNRHTTVKLTQQLQSSLQEIDMLNEQICCQSQLVHELQEKIAEQEQLR